MKKIGRILLTGMAACCLLSGCGFLTEMTNSGLDSQLVQTEPATGTSASDAASGTTAVLTGAAVSDTEAGTSLTSLTSESTLSQTVSETTSLTALTTTTSSQTTAPATSAAVQSSTVSTLTSSQTQPQTSTTTKPATSASVSSVTSVSTASTSTTKATTKTASGGSYALSDADNEFLSGCVFVGDSICSGLSVYKILPKNNVVAKGCVAARSIFDYKFSVGGVNCGLISALTSLKPQNVIFSMGMNDVNMTSAEKYCENYKGILTKVQEALPNAKLYVASITPISADSTFCTNSRIDNFNSTIKSYLATNFPAWGYVDIATLLKNQYNGLSSGYNGGDGIHLAPAAYKTILYQVCRQIGPAQ